MIYREQAPATAFAPFIERFWYFEPEAHDAEAFEHVIVPDGTASLCLIEPIPHIGAFISLTGPASQAVRVPVQRGLRYSGVRLRAGAIRAVLGLEAVRLVNRMMPLIEVVPDLGTTMMRACAGRGSLADFSDRFEAVAGPKLRPEAQDNVVCELARRMNISDGFTPLSEIMQGFDVGERQLRRRFQRETGLTPKVYSRLRRVRRACIDLAYGEKRHVAAISSDHGYADQPHFNRELKAVFGLSPHQLTDYLHQIRHFNVEGVRNVQATPSAAE